MIDEGAHPARPTYFQAERLWQHSSRARRKVHGRFLRDEDFNIAQGLIRLVGVGKIVRRDEPRAKQIESEDGEMIRL